MKSSSILWVSAKVFRAVSRKVLQVAPVFIGDGEDVGQGEPLPQVKIHHMLFAADHLDSAGAQLGEGGVDEISAECR